ncbi:MAG: synthase subunit gamma [Candidatus Midichloriaceae bacterium]|jgi:F-type H+-transporting ATPase subunit gamma|nr:synthase subunit gamma [Candidatus Midichloriaceae bacterium]
MPSLKSIKLRIKSVKSTQKITKAMQMVAASKLRRAREQAESSSIYASKMGMLVQALACGIDKTSFDKINLLHGSGDDKVHLLIVITSDRGLCGSFNHALCKQVRAKIQQLESSGKQVKLICIGKRGFDLLRGQHKDKIIKTYQHLAGKSGVKFEQIREIVEDIINEFNNNSFNVCSLFYSKFQSSISQVPNESVVIPFQQDEECFLENGCEFEPNQEEILESLLPKNLAVQFYMAMLESISSEQAARMTAMDNATRNSGDMIKRLQLIYNRTRQAHITRELIEIISGAEAV